MKVSRLGFGNTAAIDRARAAGVPEAVISTILAGVVGRPGFDYTRAVVGMLNGAIRDRQNEGPASVDDVAKVAARLGHNPAAFKGVRSVPAANRLLIALALGRVVHMAAPGQGRKTVVEEKSAAAKADKLHGRQRDAYDRAIDELSQGIPGQHDHLLKGRDGERSRDLSGSGKGRASMRIIYRLEGDHTVIITNIEDTHLQQSR